MPTTTADAFWFLNNRFAVKVAQADNADRLSVIEALMPFGEAPPLHIHHGEDEVFHILEGTMTFEVDGRTILARTGDTLLAPRGVRHGFRVTSPDGARVITITRGGFESMVRALSRPAERDGLPDPATPSPALQARLVAECGARDIEIVGPPIG